MESALEDFAVGIEASDLTNPIGIGLISGLRNQADEFGILDEYAVTLGEMLDGGVDVAHGGEVEVGDVHADLGAAVCEDADGLDAVEAAVGGANVAGDSAGSGDVGLLKVEVVGDEEAAGTDGGSSGSIVEFGAADVGTAGGIAERSIAEAFELTTADVFEKDAVGAGRGGSVEVDGDAIATPDEEAGLAGEDGAVGQGSSADGNERDDVGGADAGVDAVLSGEIDRVRRPCLRRGRQLRRCRWGSRRVVTTERLWAVSRDQSSRRTPSTCVAATICSTLAASVPSEKLGTHSMMASGFIL